MKTFISYLLLISLSFTVSNSVAQEFQGKAIYLSKSSLDLGSWGSRMSEAQKKQVKARLKNRLEKTYILTFNRTESLFKEEEKIDALSGATDSWGKNFTAGDLYKNIKTNTILQQQEFYGKNFLVNDSIQKIDWQLSSETKKIGNYLCSKAIALIPTSALNWYNFSWSELRNKTTDDVTPMTELTAWYTPQIPVSSGPLEYQGLPGLILEINNGETTMLCSKLILNPSEQEEIEAPDKGKEINKTDYKATITKKMVEMRNNRGGRR